MLQVFSGNGAFDMIADDEACAIGIREDDQTPLFGHGSEQRQLLFVLENAEAGGFENGSIHNLRQGIPVVASLHNNCFPDFNHVLPPKPAAEPEAPAGVRCRQRRF